MTTTRESWHDGTYSHSWGASPIVGVTFGIVGVHAITPTYRDFEIRPRLGSLRNLQVVVPTLRGMINVTIMNGKDLYVNVPCNTRATLCLPKSDDDVIFSVKTHRLILDNNVEVKGRDTQSGHFCMVDSVGCGDGGLMRVLRGEVLNQL